MKNFGKLQLNPLSIKIIAFIKARPCLWDRNNLLSRNNKLKNKEWTKLACQTHLCVDEIKQKWENIRRAFRQRLFRMRMENLTECNWPYFPFLLFLVKQIDETMINCIAPVEHYMAMYRVDTFEVDSDDIVLKLGATKPLLNDDTNEELIKPLSNDYTNEELIIKSEPELSLNDNLEEIEATYLDEPDTLNDDPIMDNKFDSSSTSLPTAKKLRLKEEKTESDMLFLLSFVDVLKSFESQKQLPLRIRIIQTLNSEQLDYDKIDAVEMHDLEYPRDSCEAIFLASLYPYLKIVPDYRKLTVRSKLTDLFNNEIEPEFTAIEEYVEN